MTYRVVSVVGIFILTQFLPYFPFLGILVGYLASCLSLRALQNYSGLFYAEGRRKEDANIAGCIRISQFTLTKLTL
jgi:hypothetical protein